MFPRTVRILILALLAAAPAIVGDGDFDRAFDGGFATHALDLGAGGSVEIAGVAAARWYEPFPLQRRRVPVAVAESGDGTFVRDTWLVRLLAAWTQDGPALPFGGAGPDGFGQVPRFARHGAVETPDSGGTDQRVRVARLANSSIFADGFEPGSTGAW